MIVAVLLVTVFTRAAMSNSSSSSGIRGNGIILYEKITDEFGKQLKLDKLTQAEIVCLVNQRLNSAMIYTGSYDDCIYFTGNYINSHFMALNMKEKQGNISYDLLFYNCADAVCDVLLAGIDPKSELHIGIKDIRDHHFYPSIMHDCVLDILK